MNSIKLCVHCLLYLFVDAHCLCPVTEQGFCYVRVSVLHCGRDGHLAAKVLHVEVDAILNEATIDKLELRGLI
jgi:hypothetical protein